MTETADQRARKRFKVRAILKYHVDVGVFEADSEEGAKKTAEESDRFERISYKAPGGVYDLEAEELQRA